MSQNNKKAKADDPPKAKEKERSFGFQCCTLEPRLAAELDQYSDSEDDETLQNVLDSLQPDADEMLIREDVKSRSTIQDKITEVDSIGRGGIRTSGSRKNLLLMTPRDSSSFGAGKQESSATFSPSHSLGGPLAPSDATPVAGDLKRTVSAFGMHRTPGRRRKKLSAARQGATPCFLDDVTDPEKAALLERLAAPINLDSATPSREELAGLLLRDTNKSGPFGAFGKGAGAAGGRGTPKGATGQSAAVSGSFGGATRKSSFLRSLDLSVEDPQGLGKVQSIFRGGDAWAKLGNKVRPGGTGGEGRRGSFRRVSTGGFGGTDTSPRAGGRTTVKEVSILLQNSVTLGNLINADDSDEDDETFNQGPFDDEEEEQRVRNAQWTHATVEVIQKMRAPIMPKNIRKIMKIKKPASLDRHPLGRAISEQERRDRHRQSHDLGSTSASFSLTPSLYDPSSRGNSPYNNTITSTPHSHPLLPLGRALDSNSPSPEQESKNANSVSGSSAPPQGELGQSYSGLHKYPHSQKKEASFEKSRRSGTPDSIRYGSEGGQTPRSDFSETLPSGAVAKRGKEKEEEAARKKAEEDKKKKKEKSVPSYLQPKSYRASSRGKGTDSSADDGDGGVKRLGPPPLPVQKEGGDEKRPRSQQQRKRPDSQIGNRRGGQRDRHSLLAITGVMRPKTAQLVRKRSPSFSGRVQSPPASGKELGGSSRPATAVAPTPKQLRLQAARQFLKIPHKVEVSKLSQPLNSEQQMAVWIQGETKTRITLVEGEDLIRRRPATAAAAGSAGGKPSGGRLGGW